MEWNNVNSDKVQGKWQGKEPELTTLISEVGGDINIQSKQASEAKRVLLPESPLFRFVAVRCLKTPAPLLIVIECLSFITLVKQRPTGADPARQVKGGDFGNI